MTNFMKHSLTALALGFFCLLFWATSETKKSENNEATTTEVAATETETTSEWTCDVCKTKFSHNGIEIDRNGDCKTIEEPLQGFLCSCECAKEARKKSDQTYEEVLEKASYQADNDCEFQSDNDVLMYLIGKSFTQDGGSITIKFDESGANISGLQYQWMSYTSLGGYKGKVKLSSTDPSRPNGTMTLYVSCREKSVTDGQIVLFLN